MRRFFFAFLAIITFAFPAFAQAKHPFTFEDMMKLKRVGDPQVSPDGKWVIFSVVDVNLDANTKTPHIWIVPTAGGQEREIIADQDADRPRWAPDGKRFAFISTKEGGSQVWIAEFSGTVGAVTAAWKLTSNETEAGGELWSPDGKNILFTSDVYPQCDSDDPRREMDCNARSLRAAEESKVKAQVFTHLLYRHWSAYKEGKRTHILIVPAPVLLVGQAGTPAGPAPKGDPARGMVMTARDLTPGDYDSPVFSLGGQDDYAFSPDGQEICYTSNHDKNPAASTNNDLWIVPVNAGTGTDHVGTGASPVQVLAQTRNITADNPASDSTPLYSPDGRYIAYRAQQRPGYESDRFRLMLYDRKTGKVTNLTENFDSWVGSFDWIGRHDIVFSADNEGMSPLYMITPEICLERCHPIKVLNGYNGDISVTENTLADRSTSISATVVVSRMSLRAPSGIFVLEHSDCAVGLDKIKAALLGESKDPLPGCGIANIRQLTHLNDVVLSHVDMSALESFWFTGRTATKSKASWSSRRTSTPARNIP